MGEEARARQDAVRASPLYPQIQEMNSRLNKMRNPSNRYDPSGNPEYEQLKSELFALRDKAAGGSPTPAMSRPSPNSPYGGGLGGLMRRFDPRRMSGGFPGMQRGFPGMQRGFPGMFGRRGGGFGGMFGRRRPPPFFGGGQFGGRRPFPGMYRGMPTFMNRMGGGGRFGGMQRSPWESSRRYEYGGMQRDRGGYGEGTASPFGGGFRPPFFQQSRQSYNPIPQIDTDAFNQFRQRVDQRPPTSGEASTFLAGGASAGANSPFGKPVFNADGTIFQTSNAPQIPQELIDAQMSSVQQGPPVAGGTGSLYGTPASQEEIDRMKARMSEMTGGIGGMGGMMGGAGGIATPSIARLSPEVIAAAKARRNMNRR
tara:strand:+ start:219 stop:1325 length:1107 start_codon:yes stop_codon:yes gene_type:complete